jgi:hypothetical protein
MSVTINGTTVIDASGNLQNIAYNSGTPPYYFCRGFVRFSLDVIPFVGTPYIIDEQYVSSVADLGVGRYTINFFDSMPDANYAVAGSCRRSGAAYDAIFSLNSTAGSYSTTALSVSCSDGSNGALLDPTICNVAWFR